MGFSFKTSLKVEAIQRSPNNNNNCISVPVCTDHLMWSE